MVEGDLDDDSALDRALEGCRLAYYLVHSMEGGVSGGYADRDRRLAEAFVRAAERAHVRRIVFLTRVSIDGESSEHLDSRREVEDILSGGGPELVSLRASMIVGAESDSFRTLAQIVERLPVLALPNWRDTRTQPVAIADVVAALAAAADAPAGRYAIAGPDTLTIEEMIEQIGELQGNVRPTVPLPISSSRLEGAVTALVADSEREVVEPLMEGLHEDLLVSDNTLKPVFGVTPTPFQDAARVALTAMVDRSGSG